jgi:MobA/MobL family protein
MVSRDVQAMLGSAREAQNSRLAQVAALRVVTGLILFLPDRAQLALRLLSGGLATAALGEDSSSAGAGLMSRANP